MASITLPLFGVLAQVAPNPVKRERQRANSNVNATTTAPISVSVGGYGRGIGRPKSEMPLVSVQESLDVEPWVIPGATTHAHANTPTLGYANQLGQQQQKSAPSPSHTTSADALGHGHDHRASAVLSQTCTDDNVLADTGSLFVPVTALCPAPDALAPGPPENEDEDEYEYDDLLLDLDVDVEAGGDGVTEEKTRERRRAKDRRIRRWLEQQCRFVLDVEEGGLEGSGSEAETGSRSGSSGEEEEELSGSSSENEVVEEREREGDHALEGDLEARDVVGGAESVPPAPDFPLSTPATTTPGEGLVTPSTSALPGSSAPAAAEVDISPKTSPDGDVKADTHPTRQTQPPMRSEESQSARADSPLLGYPSSIGSESCSSLLGVSSSHLNVLSSSGVASTSGSRSRPRSRLRPHGHAKTSSDGMGGSVGVGISAAEDPLRYPARNYVRVLSEGGEDEWEGLSAKRRKKKVKGKGKDGKKERRGREKGREKEVIRDHRRDDHEEEDARLALAVCMDGRDKPLPLPPAASPSPDSTSTSTSSPEAEAEPALPQARTSAHAHTPSEALSSLSLSSTKTTATVISPPVSTSTSQVNTPESSFSVPTSVSTPCTSADGSFNSEVSCAVEGETKSERTRRPSAASRSSFSYSGTTPLPLSLLRSQSQGVLGLVNASTNGNSNVTANASGTWNAKKFSQLPLGPGPPPSPVVQQQHQRSVSGMSTSSIATSAVSLSRQSSQSGPHSHSHSISRTGSISQAKAKPVSLSRRSSVSHSHTGSTNEGAGAPGAVLPVSDTVATPTSTTTISRRPSMLLLMCPPSLPGLGEEDAGVSVGASPTRTLPASQFHLPTAMQYLRRSESMSQMQQQIQIQVQPQPQPQQQPQQAAVVSPLPPNMPPTRRQSRANSLSASMVIAGAGASVYTLDSSAAPSRTRSRAGSLSLAQTLAQSFGNSGSSLDRGSGSGGSVGHGDRRESTAETLEEEEGADVVRNAVYIDSEEVRERLDVLIGRVKEREEDGYASDELFLAYHDGEEHDQGDEDSLVSGAPVRRSLRPSPLRPPPAPPLDLNTEQNRTQNQEQSLSADRTIGMSMSRWSLASSAIDEEEKGKPPGKEKERSLLPTEPFGTGRSSSEKKRGRLVSFISRLSAAVVTPSSPSTPTIENGEPVPPTPPLPSPPASSHMALSFDPHAQVPKNAQIIPSTYAQRPRAFTTSVFPNPPNGVPMGIGERGRSNSAADLLALGTNQRPQQLQQYQNQEQYQLPSPVSPSGPYYPPQHYPDHHVQGQPPNVYHRLGDGLVKSASASILRSPPGQYQGTHVQIAHGPTPRRSNLQLRRPLSGRVGDVKFGYGDDEDEADDAEEDKAEKEEDEEEDYGVVLAKNDTWPGEWEDREETTGYPTNPVVHNMPANLAPISPVLSPVEAHSPPPPLPLAPLHRLKSFPSLVNLNLSLLSNGSASGSANPTTSPPPSAPLPGQSKGFPTKEKEKGKGFIGFVQRIGRNKNSNQNTNSLNVSIPGAGASRAQIVTVSGQTESAEGSVASTPAHSPNSSMDGNELRAYNDGGVSTPVEFEDDQSTRSPTASISIGSGLLASFNLSKPNKPLSASKALGGGGPKRTLCISGVALDDTRSVEVVRSWCESFGEVKQMIRGADGSLLVDFKKASVAETVCRVQAQVTIKGVGSVNLSWFTKKKTIL